MKPTADELWATYYERRDAESTNALLAFYFPLVLTVARSRFKRKKRTPEELAGYGVDGLRSAIQSYDPSRGVKFPSFASNRIAGAIIDGMRSELPKGGRRAVMLGEGYTPYASLETIRAAGGLEPAYNSNLAAAMETADVFDHLAGLLAKREGKLLKLLYIEGLNIRVAAERLGCSESRVSQLHKELRGKLRKVPGIERMLTGEKEVTKA